MARFKDRKKAIRLRLKGKSYSEIKAIIKASKSTLSLWLRNYPLSEERIRQLRDRNPRRIENYMATRARKKKERLDKIYETERRKLRPLTKRELFIAGLFLYWGEGAKTKECEVSVSNTNPAVIKFFMRWLIESLGVSKTIMKVRLHLYNDMSIKKEIEFWSKELSIPKKQFRKPYIKTSSRKMITYKNKFKHGTCNLVVCNARLAEKVFANLKIVEDRFNV